MTLQSVLTKVQYSGDDSTTGFPITYKFYENSGIRVILTDDATGVETVQTLTTHYTLSGGSGSTGNCTMITPPATGETLTIKSDIPNTQDTAFPLGGDFPSTAVEQRMDILTRLIQQQSEDIARAILLPESSSNSALSLPNPVTGEFLKWDASGNLINTTISEAGAATGVDLTDTNATKDKLISNLIGKTWEDYKDVGHLPLAGGTLTGNLALTSKVINEAQGANIASAETTDIGAATGNFIFITGTTTITGLGTVQAGTERTVKFVGVLILTQNATSLILPGAANITTVAGDRAIFRSLGSGNWICISYIRADGSAVSSTSGNVVQMVRTTDGEAASTTNTITKDDSIMQNTEGAEFMTRTITPRFAASRLLITVTIVLTNSGVEPGCFVGLFQDSTANALASIVFDFSANANSGLTVTFSHEMAAGTESETAFKVRAASTSDTTTMNGIATASRLGGGVLASSITILELKS